MTSREQTPDSAVKPVVFEPDTACASCGRFGAYRFIDRALCDECVAGCGSCCPEFGKDDLWADRKQ